MEITKRLTEAPHSMSLEINQEESKLIRILNLNNNGSCEIWTQIGNLEFEKKEKFNHLWALIKDT